MAARKAHNLEVPGSSPGPATKKIIFARVASAYAKASADIQLKKDFYPVLRNFAGVAQTVRAKDS